MTFDLACRPLRPLPTSLGALATALLPLVPAAALAQDAGPQDFPVVAPATACADLVGTDLADIGGEGSGVTQAAKVTSEDGIVTCSVTGVLAPAINFTLLLPTETWTQRYLQLGCGGLCGRISIDEVGAASGCAPLEAGGFAIAATDMGHTADDATWGDDPQKRADFAHRAQHLTAVASKRLIKAFYGQAPAFSYFNGCSDGGREALIEAQRYPDDFDGIIAGAPAQNFQVQNGLYHAWQARANRDADGRAILLADRLPVLHAAVLAQCDGLDGLEDGLLQNPLVCTPDLAAITCAEGAADASACLTPAEVEVVRRLYDGPRDSSTGERLTAGGPMPGSELRWTVFVPEAAGDAVSSEMFSLQHLTGPAFEEPLPEGFTLADVTFDRAWFDRLAKLHPLYDATNPDLSAFEGSGGKLIMYHGWSDTDISPVNILSYYEAMRGLMGADAADGFSRLYMVPGMYHCSQGEGPYEFDMLTPLMAWVEGGAAPDAIVARQPAQAEASGFGQFQGSDEASALPGYPAVEPPSADLTRKRPLFPYPYTAAYDGTGDPDDAGSFVRSEDAIGFTALDWAGSIFFAPYDPREI